MMPILDEPFAEVGTKKSSSSGYQDLMTFGHWQLIQTGAAQGAANLVIWRQIAGQLDLA
jgi:hypothetical protein